MKSYWKARTKTVEKDKKDLTEKQIKTNKPKHKHQNHTNLEKV